MLGLDVYVCSVWMVLFYVYPSMFCCCVVSSIMMICWFNRDAGKFNELIDSLICLISVNNTCHVYLNSVEEKCRTTSLLRLVFWNYICMGPTWPNASLLSFISGSMFLKVGWMWGPAVDICDSGVNVDVGIIIASVPSVLADCWSRGPKFPHSPKQRDRAAILAEPPAKKERYFSFQGSCLISVRREWGLMNLHCTLKKGSCPNGRTYSWLFRF